MKKNYVKPALLVETFRMDASIARTCNADEQIAHDILEAYEYVKEFMSLEDFIQKYLNDNNLNGYCYHTGTNALFLS